jgi:hypothetical protein
VLAALTVSSDWTSYYCVVLIIKINNKHFYAKKNKNKWIYFTTNSRILLISTISNIIINIYIDIVYNTNKPRKAAAIMFLIICKQFESIQSTCSIYLLYSIHWKTAVRGRGLVDYPWIGLIYSRYFPYPQRRAFLDINYLRMYVFQTLLPLSFFIGKHFLLLTFIALFLCICYHYRFLKTTLFINNTLLLPIWLW